MPAVPPPPVPMHGVLGETSSHQVKATEPLGAPPVELPVTVAESVHVLPTEFELGGVTEVVKPGVATATLRLVIPNEAAYRLVVLYWPVIVSVPTGAAFALHCPEPLERLAVHKVVEPIENMTEPAGMPDVVVTVAA